MSVRGLVNVGRMHGRQNEGSFEKWILCLSACGHKWQRMENVPRMWERCKVC